MAENGNVNLVLGKALSVLPETEPFEPVRNLLHRRPSTDLTLSVLDRHVVGVYQRSPRSNTLAELCTDQGAEKPVNVRFGSKADICAAPAHVRFTPKSGPVRCTSLCLLWAISGHWSWRGLRQRVSLSVRWSNKKRSLRRAV